MKWFISMVLPGVDDVFAKSLRPKSMLISEDLPTLERPINAYSCLSSVGHLLSDGALIRKRALFIIIVCYSSILSRL